MSVFSVPCGRGSIPFTIDGQDAADLTTATIRVGLEELAAAEADHDLLRLLVAQDVLGEGMRLAVAGGACLSQLLAWTELPEIVVRSLVAPVTLDGGRDA